MFYRVFLAVVLSCFVVVTTRADAWDRIPDSTTFDEWSPSEMRSALLFAGFGRSARVPRKAETSAERRRSVPMAFAASALVPGVGQMYNEQRVKAVAMIALEAALIAGYLVWRNQGMDAEDAYTLYAHEFWDPARYSVWLNDYVDYLEQEQGASIGASAIEVPTGIDFSAPESWSTQERQIVRTFFDEIRAVEGVVYHPETGASFSHKLPYFGEQQYYELVGKYFQFAPGWIDYPVWRQGGEFTGAIDPELTGPGGTKPNVQGRFREYARDHADANTLLRRASRTSALVVLSHVVSAIDAAIAAKLHNDRLDANLELSYDALDEPLFMASMSWRF